MKNLPRLGAVALAVMLTSAACSNNRGPLAYPGSARPNVVDRNGDGYDDRTGERISGNSARPNKDKGRRDEVRCNNGNGNGNGNGRCRNGNRGNGNGKGRGNE
ncbi:MAG TPA: hypothetical protein VE871_19300 [Longimicrobium sp.]|nr:hypothetical protein [Longimicrobium sp.]